MRIRLPGSYSAWWVLAETAASSLLALFSMLVIGRVIGPHEAGVGAVAVAAFLVLDIFGSAVFPDALVQRPNLGERVLRTALTASLLVAVGAGLLLMISAPLLATVMEQEAITWLALAMVPLLPLSALSGTASGAALRVQRFRLLAMRVLIGQPMALGAGLLAAHGGLGAWAMVINQAVASVSVFLLFMFFGRLPLRPALDAVALRELWPVAGPQLGAIIVTVGRYRLFLLALGATVAEAVLGQAHFAFRMVDAVVMMVWQAASRIGMPRLCALQQNRTALAECYGQLAQFQALLGLSSAVGIALIADDLVLALLGPEWSGTGTAAEIAGYAAALTFLHGNHFSLFVALGKARLNLYIAVAQLALPLLTLLLAQPETSVGIALAWATASLVVTPPVVWIVLRELDQPLTWLFCQVAPAVLALTTMVPAVLAVQGLLTDASPLLRCTTAALAGGFIFGVAAWALLGGRPPAILRTTSSARQATA